MNTVNKVILIGHLGDDVKMHYFDSGNCIGRFSLATNESYINKKTGEKITNTEWHNIIVKNKLAETCEKFLSKGDKIYLEGKIKSRQYEINNQMKNITEIHVNEISFLSLKKSNQNA